MKATAEMRLKQVSVVLLEILNERSRQEAKCVAMRAEGRKWLTCADPGMELNEKLAVLGEEFGEVCKELCDARAERRPPSSNLRVELVQLAAVAVAWAESLSGSVAAGPRRPGREALGDAVVPQCAELVFRRLIDLDKGA